MSRLVREHLARDLLDVLGALAHVDDEGIACDAEFGEVELPQLTPVS